MIKTQERKKRTSIPCAFHPQKQLHTFCTQPQCLLPLCSQCLGIHNEDHRRSQTFGNYQELNHIIEDIKRKLTNKCAFLEELSEEYTEDFWQKQTIIDDCRKRLQTLKEKLYRQMERMFQEIERNLALKVNEFHDRIHSEYQIIENKIHHSYQSTLRTFSNLQHDDQTHLNSTRPSIKLQNQIQSECESQRAKFLHPSSKIIKTVIEYLGGRQFQRSEKERRQLREQVGNLKRRAIRISQNETINSWMEGMREMVGIEMFDDEDNLYYLSSRPKLTVRK